MRIFICEYVAGGGLAGEPLPPTLLREGAAMLRAVLADFVTLDAHHIITTRDARLADDLPARRIQTVGPGRFEAVFDACLSACDAALVVAPEATGVLAGLTERVEAAGILNLGSSSAAIRVAADKLRTIDRLASAGLPVPPTIAAETPAEAARLGFPLVLKPRDGVGCLGVRAVADAVFLEEAWREATAESPGSPLIAERLVSGRPASVSLVSDGCRAVALSLNAQTIVEEKRFEYRGGIVPLDHPLRERALEVAARACHAVPGLRGYVGVDMVLGDDAILLEINPRLTTAYVGLRRALDQNLAGALLAAARGELPDRIACVARAHFSAEGQVSIEALRGGR